MRISLEAALLVLPILVSACVADVGEPSPDFTRAGTVTVLPEIVIRPSTVVDGEVDHEAEERDPSLTTGEMLQPAEEIDLDSEGAIDLEERENESDDFEEAEGLGCGGEDGWEDDADAFEGEGPME